MESGIRALPVALALRLPGDDLPWGRGGQPDASLWQACSDTVLQRRVAIEVAGLAVWAEALPETKLTDEQVPLYCLTSSPHYTLVH